ncbi:MAG: endonuclease V [Candidatus Hydrogenedentota bacterium]|nr:MAG: endonuclease V [Candidatus Hydrogenedentota bacterium]
MRLRRLHSWILSPARAREIQERLASRLVLRPPKRLRHRIERFLASSPRGAGGTNSRSRRPLSRLRVLGLDVSYAKPRAETDAFAAAVLMEFSAPELPGRILEVVTARKKNSFPYVPGLLSFRELPALLPVLERVRGETDLVMVDGQGTAHPRRLGLACHLGLLLDLPTLGCAKSRLVGGGRPPDPNRGSWSPLLEDGEIIGAMVRTRSGVNPVFVSPGHRIDLETAVAVVVATSHRYRIPDPTREAHRAVTKYRIEATRAAFRKTAK